MTDASTKVRIVPFEPEHLETFKHGEVERMAMGDGDLGCLGQKKDRSTVSLRESSPDGARTLGIGALVEIDGALRASLLLSDECRARPFLLHRVVKRCLSVIRRLSPRPTLEATVDPDFDVGAAWLHRLGFRCIGDLPDYLGTGKPYRLYRLMETNA